MKKELATISTLAAAAVMLNAAPSVKAEEVLLTPENSTSDESKVKAMVPTKEEVDTAKKEADEATAQKESQDVVVKEKESVVEQDQKALNENDNKVKELENDKPTPEKIQSQEELIKTDEKDLKEKQDQEKKDKERLDSLSSKVKDQEKVTQDKNKVMEQDQESVKTAEKKVKAAEDSLSGLHEKEIKDEAKNAESNLKESENNKKSAEKELEAAKEFDKKLDKDTQDKEKELSGITIKANKELDGINKLESDLEDKNKVLEESKKDLDKKQAKVDATTDVKVSEKYVEALKKAADYSKDVPNEDRVKAVKDLIGMNDEMLKNNKYVADPNDSTDKLDPNNIPADKLTELSNYAATLINSIREQFGNNSKVVVTPGALKATKEVTDKYVKDDYNQDSVNKQGHYTDALNKVALDNGLRKGAIQENMSGYYYKMDSVTMADAKRIIHESILNFMFNGYEYAHAMSIAGIGYKDETQSFAFGLSSRSDITGTHFEFINKENVLDKSKFDTTPIENPINKEKYLQDLKDAKEKVNREKAEISTLQTKLDADKAQYSKTVEKLNEVSKELKALKDTEKKTPSAEANLNSKDELLTKAQTRNTLAQEALSNLLLSKDEKIKILNSAKETLEKAKATLALSNSELDKELKKLESLISDKLKAQNKLKASTLAVNDASTKLVKDKNKLFFYKNYDSVLKAAKDKSKDLKAKLETSSKELEQAKELLLSLTKVAKEKEFKYNALNVSYLADLEIKRLEKEKELLALAQAQAQANALAGGEQNLAKSSVLPNTGEVSSIFNLLGLASGLSGLQILRRKKNK